MVILNRPNVDCNYIRLRNLGDYEAIFHVDFVFRGKAVELKSSRIKYNKMAKLCIPTSVSDVTLTIDIFWGNYSKRPYSDDIDFIKNTCILALGTFNIPIIREEPCV